MENQFYNVFDTERVHTPTHKPSTPEVRSAFQIDRDRIVFSYAFRRLQSKTQVFQSGEFDFYRTRLTHSIEVAKIARSITTYLNHKSSLLNDSFYIDDDLVEAVGMAHDLGHPPFGHIGERKLNELMGPWGGFEGNAQTLRILTQLFYHRKDESKGMNPSRALLDGILKYKALHQDLLKQTADGNVLTYPKHHFLYDTDSVWLQFAFGEQLTSIEEHCINIGSSINKFKSLECQIMDWADDTAYSINDIIDSIQTGYLYPHKIEQWAAEQSLTSEDQSTIEELLAEINNSSYESFLNKQIGAFIHATHLLEIENPMSDISNRYRFAIEIDPIISAKSSIYKRLAVDLIFRSPQIHRIEYKGALILEKLFNALKENYINASKRDQLNLIPDPFGKSILNAPNSDVAMRILCDSIAEMTDALAIRAYKRLFDPDYGSILDIV